VQAQTKPPAYFVALVNVKDQDGYNKEFLPKMLPTIKEGVPVLAASTRRTRLAVQRRRTGS
jgi:hypothetical protein